MYIYFKKIILNLLKLSFSLALIFSVRLQSGGPPSPPHPLIKLYLPLRKNKRNKGDGWLMVTLKTFNFIDTYKKEYNNNILDPTNQ